jgi:type II secretory pathway pseudopilin PulG
MSRNVGQAAGPQKGFTYVGLLIAVVVLGVALAATGEVWRTAAKREREQELLFAGREIRNAIAGYYSAPGVGQPRYPRSLGDLLEDRRGGAMRRHLRRLYADPMTRKADWGLVEAPGGGFAGVHSLSEERPMKTGGFVGPEVKFEGAERYSAWKFVFEPRGAVSAPPPAARK